VTNKIYEIDEFSPFKPEELITETGLYYRKRLRCWEIWYVESPDVKVKIGYSTKQLGIESAQSLYNEFLFIAEHEVSSVYDLVDPEEIH